jgi:hypothetical protein
MDTIVIATGMPFLLAFLDQDLDDVVELWDRWAQSGELVRVRHEDPARDAVVRLRPAAMGTVEFIANESGGRRFPDRMLLSLPHLQAHPDAADLPPDRAHYWSLSMSGFTARTETSPDGNVGLVLGNWEFGRL